MIQAILKTGYDWSRSGSRSESLSWSRSRSGFGLRSWLRILSKSSATSTRTRNNTVKIIHAFYVIFLVSGELQV